MTRMTRQRITVFVTLIAVLLGALPGAVRAEAPAAAPEKASTEASAATEPARAAVRGVLDLSDGTLERTGWTMLEGEWAFYWNELLEPAASGAPGGSGGSFEGRTPAYVPVPDVWSSYVVDGEPLGSDGYATYRLAIRLAPGDAARALALYMPSVATAYQLWVDGRPLGGNGVVGASRAEMVPKNVPKVYVFSPSGDTVDVVVQVSNFVQRKGGLWEGIRFGTADAIGQLRTRNVMMESTVWAGIVVMGLYHLGLFAYRRKDVAPLFFAGVCLAVGARMLFLGQTLAVYAVPSIPWEIGVKIEYISAAIGIMLLLLFVRAQYPNESHRAAAAYSVAFTAAVVGFVLSTPAATYTTFLLPIVLAGVLPTILYILYVFAAAAARRRQGSTLNGIGFTIFAISIGNDILLYTQWVSAGNFIPFGLLAALFTQSLNIAGRFSHAYGSAERLADALRQTNERLEAMVEERTHALREANERLERSNDELTALERARRQLMSTISHELGTPLTSIQGFVKLMLDGVLPGDDRRTLRLIYDKTLFLDRIIQDLFDLSKLEARRLGFRYQSVDAAAFLKQMAEGYAWNENETGVALQIGRWEPEPGAARKLRVDPIRIEQVFANLVANAKKFTPAGGAVRVGFTEAALTSGAPALRVEVTDTGVGVPEAELPFVFERFYQGAASANARLDGAGLGLAIAKQIVEQHGGEIGVSSAPSRGSSFYFLLPFETGGASI
ncbi:sensor histidine kinase [Paenibacillus sp.]|uniref:sensor histidine kinase n=1 Tax=Paenibacillus sp. TaxID=58172 RepID=UPI002D66C663|nr:sensor histidine kinase [Paenibacillus sp.]HZG57994.1 sensor histidine kinase [Paenibacillus sp.]